MWHVIGLGGACDWAVDGKADELENVVDEHMAGVGQEEHGGDEEEEQEADGEEEVGSMVWDMGTVVEVRYRRWIRRRRNRGRTDTLYGGRSRRRSNECTIG